jgi:hypothetical protein
VYDEAGEEWFEAVSARRAHWHRPVLHRPIPDDDLVVDDK